MKDLHAEGVRSLHIWLVPDHVQEQSELRLRIGQVGIAPVYRDSIRSEVGIYGSR